MIIDDSNYTTGNRALASVLLLYFHLLREGGVTNDQTVYLDQESFNGFDYLDVQVDPRQQMEIDQGLLREGAVIYVLCELNDVISEYEDDFLQQPMVWRILDEDRAGRLSALPEAEVIMQMVSLGELGFDFDVYRKRLASIFQKYVAGRFRALVGSGNVIRADFGR